MLTYLKQDRTSIFNTTLSIHRMVKSSFLDTFKHKFIFYKMYSITE